MNKYLLGVFVGASISAPVIAEPVIYGKANVSFQNADENEDSKTELTSNASRLGVKGSLAVDGGVEAIYQAEFEVFVDDGDKDGETITQRNIFVGLKGDFGTIKAGQFDSPLKVSQKKVDLFNDLEGDIKNIITVNDNRPDNIVAYTTPTLGQVSATLAVISSEEDGLDDGVSASLAFEQDGLYLSAALDQNVEAQDYDVYRLVAQYNIGDFQVGALYENAEAEGSDDVDAAFASLQYKIDDWALKAQYGTSDISAEDGKSLSLGVDYKLAKPLKVFAYYTQLESENGDDESDYLGLGVELKF